MQATGPRAARIAQTCQSGMVPNHHSYGCAPCTETIASSTAIQITPAANGTRHARASAAVRRASDPGAVPMASAVASVDRVNRAVATRLGSPMKNAGITGIDSSSPMCGSSLST